MPPRVLMVTSFYPPMLAPGCARPFAFSKHLPSWGVLPRVLTPADPGRYPMDPAPLAELSDAVQVHRFVADDARHCAGERAALGDPPPRLLPMLGLGLGLLRRFGADLVWATAPRFDAFQAAAALGRVAGLPVILDYRDPLTYGMLADHWPESRRRRERAAERRCLDAAARVVFTSEAVQRRMEKLHPEHAERFSTIPNGFDEAGADGLDTGARAGVREGLPGERLTLAFVGTLYFVDGRCQRDPGILLDALRVLARTHPEVAGELRVRFVGECPGVLERARERGVEAMVEATGPVPVAESRRIMARSDVLLHLQTLAGPAADCIAGKLYEYLRAGRPILGVVAPGGGDDRVLETFRAGPRTGIRDPEAVAAAIRSLWQRWRRGTLCSEVDAASLAGYERGRLAGRLAALMEEVLRESASVGAA